MRIKTSPLWAVSCLLLVIIVLSSFACSKPSPAPQPAPAPATQKPAASSPVAPTSAAPKPAASPSAVAKAIKWNLHSTVPVGTPRALVADAFAAKIKERSGGRLEITNHHAGAMGYKGPELLKVLRDNLVELAMENPTHFSPRCPTIGLIYLPFIFKKESDPETAWKIATPYWETSLAKWDVKHFFSAALPQLNVTAKNQVLTMPEIAKLKFRSSGAPMTKLVELLGGKAVSIPLADAYTSFATGVVDATITSATSFREYKWHEVFKSVSVWNTTISANMVIGSKKAFDALPKDLQDIVTKAAQESYPDFWKVSYYSDQDDRKWLMANAGVKFYDVDLAEMTKANTATKPLIDDWLKRSGADGQKMFDEVMKAISK